MLQEHASPASKPCAERATRTSLSWFQGFVLVKFNKELLMQIALPTVCLELPICAAMQQSQARGCLLFSPLQLLINQMPTKITNPNKQACQLAVKERGIDGKG